MLNKKKKIKSNTCIETIVSLYIHGGFIAKFIKVKMGRAIFIYDLLLGYFTSLQVYFILTVESGINKRPGKFVVFLHNSLNS